METLPLHLRSKFPARGYAGLAIISLSEILLFARAGVVGTFFTPLAWTGYILVVDAACFSLQGSSLLSARRREFIAMLPWSIVCWLVFEAYNLYLRNWSYAGLPENDIARTVGYGWSFATILPAILETADLIKMSLPRRAARLKLSRAAASVSVVSGVILVTLPVVLPQGVAAKLFGLVWVGFFLLLDPLYTGSSVLEEMKASNYSTCISLALSGIVCGFFWEFWNYWAAAKWHYSVPIPFAGPKLFEMPLAGYLGFIPFAFDCYAFQEILVRIFPSLRRSA